MRVIVGAHSIHAESVRDLKIDRLVILMEHRRLDDSNRQIKIPLRVTISNLYSLNGGCFSFSYRRKTMGTYHFRRVKMTYVKYLVPNVSEMLQVMFVNISLKMCTFTWKQSIADKLSSLRRIHNGVHFEGNLYCMLLPCHWMFRLYFSTHTLSNCTVDLSERHQ